MTDMNQPYPLPRHARYALSVLVAVYILSFVDRSILTLLVGPIKASLHISDVQVSLLHGFAFAIFYTFLGIPIARLADRRNRTRIIAAGAMAWSVMTALCGIASRFSHMFLARVGVGVGEAALSPAAYSMLADYYPPAKLTQAMSIYTASAYVGGGLALIAGGALIALVPPTVLPVLGLVQPWQMVFLILGLPGVFMGLLVLTVREPARRDVKVAGATDEVPSVGKLIAHIKGFGGGYGYLTAAVIAHAMMWNGVVGWFPTYLIRHYGTSPTQVGLMAGFALLLGGATGIVLGGILSARMRRAGVAYPNHILVVIAALGGLPFGLAAPLMPTAGSSAIVYALFLFFASSPYGGIIAAYQEITPNRLRAQVSALYQFALNLAGIGFGPTLVALITEHVWASDGALDKSLLLIIAVGCPLSALFILLGRRPYGRALATMHLPTNESQPA